MIKGMILPVLVLALTTACTSSKKSELTALKDEVMAIHDEVMPKMGELMKTEKMLKKKADSLFLVSDSVTAQTCLDAASEINAANESMMNWMRNYEVDFQGDEDEIMKYLNEQKQGIEKVKEEMLATLEEGKRKL